MLDYYHVFKSISLGGGIIYHYELHIDKDKNFGPGMSNDIEGIAEMIKHGVEKCGFDDRFIVFHPQWNMIRFFGGYKNWKRCLPLDEEEIKKFWQHLVV